MENRFHLRTKANLIRIQQFNQDKVQYYTQLNEIRINKFQEEVLLHVWINGNVTAMGVHISTMREYMEDFDRKLMNYEDRYD